MILRRVNFVCTPCTDEVDPFFWPQPSYSVMWHPHGIWDI